MVVGVIGLDCAYIAFLGVGMDVLHLWHCDKSMTGSSFPSVRVRELKGELSDWAMGIVIRDVECWCEMEKMEEVVEGNFVFVML